MSLSQTSPEFSEIHVPDVMEEFSAVVKKQPTLISIIPIETDRSKYAKNHKHEWLEFSREQLSWTVNGASAIASPTVVLDDNTGVKVGDILKFVDTTGASVSVKVKVTVVDGGGTDLTVTRLGTDVEIPDNAIVYLVSRAQAEGSTEDRDSNVAPTRAFNFTQIFRRDMFLSRTLLQTELYGLSNEAAQDKVTDLVMFQAEERLGQISYELDHSVIDGYKEQRVDGGANGTMGGLLGFVTDAGSVYDAAGAALSPTILNAAIEQAVLAGALGSEMQVILCHSRQARKISAFNATGNNPVVVRGEATAGNYVAQFQSDLAQSNGGALSTIVVDRNFPEDKVLIFNPSKLKLVPMEGFGITETTDSKEDGRSFKVLGELTLEVHDADSQFILIEDLQL